MNFEGNKPYLPVPSAFSYFSDIFYTKPICVSDRCNTEKWIRDLLFVFRSVLHVSAKLHDCLPFHSSQFYEMINFICCKIELYITEPPPCLTVGTIHWSVIHLFKSRRTNFLSFSWKVWICFRYWKVLASTSPQ